MGEESSAAWQMATTAVQAIGRGFDVNFDTRFLYCKGAPGSRIVEMDDEHTRDLHIYGDVVLRGVSRDIHRFHESSGRHTSGVYSFLEMVEYFNKRASLSGSVPLGCFNSAFSFTCSENIDSATTKSLSMDGYFIPLAKLQLSKPSLVLQDHVKRAVPRSWDPISLASFIEDFGTHVITSVTIGGKDVIYLKQHKSSASSTMEVKNYAMSIGNQRFSDAERHNTDSDLVLFGDKVQGVDLFNSQGVYPQPSGFPHLNGKHDVAVIFRRSGGDSLEQSHHQWVKTVFFSPDVIEMTFSPITSLLDGVIGKEHLIRAINAYLKHKPQLEELRHFLEFQIPRVWAPVHDVVRGIPRKEPICPYLQFSLMGQKLYVSLEQVIVVRRPVTGLRLCLEGTKQNRLAIHVQHLTSLPKIMHPHWDSHVGIGAPRWRGPEEQDCRWFEPVKWKRFSHVCTAPIDPPPEPLTPTAPAPVIHVVTGAQLGVWDFGSRNVLYLKLLFSLLPGCTVRRSAWDHAPAPVAEEPPQEKQEQDNHQAGGGANKLVKFVETAEMCKGAEDNPGHWVVTGGKLGLERGRIVVRVRYSLINY